MFERLSCPRANSGPCGTLQFLPIVGQNLLQPFMRNTLAIWGRLSEASTGPTPR